MKLRHAVSFSLCSLLMAVTMSAQSLPGPVLAADQELTAPPSEPVDFFLSSKGQPFAASHPGAVGLMKKLSLPLAPPQQRPRSRRSPLVNGKLATACNSFDGTSFNLEGTNGAPEIGFPVPQDEESVDFVPSGGVSGADLVIAGANDYRGVFDALSSGIGIPLPNAWGVGVTGYYVKRTPGGCAADFEGALPHVDFDFFGDGSFIDPVFGFGDPVIAANPGRKTVYAADLRAGSSEMGIGLLRTTTSLLDDPVACPDGTHTTDTNGNDTQASHCWPNRILLGLNAFAAFVPDKPHMRVDERYSGVGAGDVYVSWTQFHIRFGRLAGSEIHLAVCPANFVSAGDCSSDIVISGPDSAVQFSHLAVRPDGVLSITYVNSTFEFLPDPSHQFFHFLESSDIKYVSCTPNGAPNPPTCSTPSLVFSDPQPISNLLAANRFRMRVYPTHDQRSVGNGFEEFVVWSRCKNSPFLFTAVNSPFEVELCGDADLVMSTSFTDAAGQAAGWSVPTLISAGAHDQVFPWVRTDHDTNTVHVIYYTSENDTTGHRWQLATAEIPPGGYSVINQIATRSLFDPSADFFHHTSFIGDYIGIAPRAGRSYLSFTSTAAQGMLNGILPGLGIVPGSSVSGQNNNLIFLRDGDNSEKGDQ